MPWCPKSFKDVASHKVDGYNMKNKTNFTTRDFISDYGSKYPDAMSIGDSMSFPFILFFMTVHVHENEMK